MGQTWTAGIDEETSLGGDEPSHMGMSAYPEIRLVICGQLFGIACDQTMAVLGHKTAPAHLDDYLFHEGKI